MPKKQDTHVPVTREHIMNASNKELKLLCNRLSLPVSGNKKKLQNRLLTYMKKKEAEEEAGTEMDTVAEVEAGTEMGTEAEVEPDIDVPTSEEIMAMDRGALMAICDTLDIAVEEESTEDIRQIILEIIAEAEGEIDEEEGGDTGKVHGEDIEEEHGGDTGGMMSDPGEEGPLPDIPDVMEPKESLEEANYVRDVLGRAEDSISLYESLFRFIRNKDKKLSSSVMVHKGIAHQFISELDKAIVCYTEALRISPRNSEARMLLDGARAISSQLHTSTTATGNEDIPLAEKHERLKGLLSRMDGPTVSSRVASTDTGISRTGPVEITLRSGPTSEPETSPSAKKREDAGKGSDERTLEEQDQLAQRLARLKEKIDIGPEGKRSGADLPVNPTENIREAPVDHKPTDISDMLKEIKVAKEKVREGGSVPDAGEAAEEKEGEAEEDKGRGEEKGKDVKGKKRDGTHTASTSAKTATPSRTGTGLRGGTLTSGSEELDDLIGGGLSAGSQIFVDALPDIEKESILYHFANSCVKASIPMIVITTTDPPVKVRSQMSMVCRGLEKAENAGEVSWIDRRSKEVLNRYTLAPSDLKPHSDLEVGILELPDNYTSIIKAVMDIASREEGGPFCLLAMSLTPLITYQEPVLIERFVGSLSSLVKEYGAYGIYSIENDMHNEKEISLMRKYMDVVVEVKANTDLADREHPALLRMAGHKKMKETRWTGYVVDEAGSYRIGW